MQQRFITALVAGALALSSTISLAQSAVPPQINYKQLSTHPFEAPHGLGVSVEYFNAGRFVVNLKNTTLSFIALAPEDIALVDEEGNQLYLRNQNDRGGSPLLPPPRLRIAPGATVHLDARLSAPEHFPVKVYFFDALCALVTE